MSITENKCQRSKIYKLISIETNDVYYGSTIEDKLTNRLSGYRQNTMVKRKIQIYDII